MLARSIGWLQETIDKATAAVWTCKAALLFEGSCCALCQSQSLTKRDCLQHQTVVCISHANSVQHHLSE